MEKKNINKRIKRKGTKIELKIRKIIRSYQMRYYCNYSKLEGKPDIVIPKRKIAIYINGCFWHNHKQKNCAIAKVPKKNRQFWEKKFEKNRKRDMRNYEKVRKRGWNIVVLWECEIKSRQKVLGLYVMENLSQLITEGYEEDVYD